MSFIKYYLSFRNNHTTVINEANNKIKYINNQYTINNKSYNTTNINIRRESFRAIISTF